VCCFHARFAGCTHLCFQFTFPNRTSVVILIPMHSTVFRFSTLLLCILSGIILASQEWTCSDSPFRLHDMSSSSSVTTAASSSSTSNTEAKSDSTSKPRRVVLIYSTRCGSTTEVANTIAQELKEKGVQIDVYKVEQVPKSLKWADYDGAVLGSCIRMRFA
jgi:sulfite reductase alpha subunit-like flavoprotein